MTISKLKKFGEIRNNFRGKGTIKLESGANFAVKFILAQLSSNVLVFTITLENSVLMDETPIIELTGKLSDGSLLNASGFFVKDKAIRYTSVNIRTHLTGYVSNFSIKKPEIDSVVLISFEITNFLFTGNELEKTIDPNDLETKAYVLNLVLDNREITMRHVKDYEKIEIELRAQGNVSVTCIASTKLTSITDIDEIIQMFDRLCDLMSIARSTLISWTSFNVTGLDGSSLISHYQNSITRNFSGSELIHKNDPINTKIFIEKAYLASSRLSDDYHIRQVSRAYIETRKGGFIESRSMSIGVMAEYIASVRARLDGHDTFLSSQIFEARWSELSSHIKPLLLAIYPEIKPKYVSTMLNIIKGLNRRPFSWKLNHLAKQLDLKAEPGEIERIVATRNSLAHQGKFVDGEPSTKQYLRMQHFIDRLLLRLFDYRGPYYDLEHNEFRKI